MEEHHSPSHVTAKSEHALSPTHGGSAGHFPLAIETSAFRAEYVSMRYIILNITDCVIEICYFGRISSLST